MASFDTVLFVVLCVPALVFSWRQGGRTPGPRGPGGHDLDSDPHRLIPTCVWCGGEWGEHRRDCGT